MKGLSIVWSKSICISRCIIKKSVKFTHSSPKSPTSVKLLMVNLQSCYINRVNIHSYCSSFVYHYFNFFFSHLLPHQIPLSLKIIINKE